MLLYVVVPKGFFPQQDTGRLIGTIQADAGHFFPAMRRSTRRSSTASSQDPAIDTIVAFTGGGDERSNPARHVRRVQAARRARR